MVPWVGLQCVIVVFLDHTHLLLIITVKEYSGELVVLIEHCIFTCVCVGGCVRVCVCMCDSGMRTVSHSQSGKYVG